MRLVIATDGAVQFVYDEGLNLASLGASEDSAGQSCRADGAWAVDGRSAAPSVGLCWASSLDEVGL